jgi:hypothetical protein
MKKPVFIFGYEYRVASSASWDEPNRIQLRTVPMLRTPLIARCIVTFTLCRTNSLCIANQFVIDWAGNIHDPLLFRTVTPVRLVPSGFFGCMYMCLNLLKSSC